jgi:hypothetical protein
VDGDLIGEVVRRKADALREQWGASQFDRSRAARRPHLVITCHDFII